MDRRPYSSSCLRSPLQAQWIAVLLLLQLSTAGRQAIAQVSQVGRWTPIGNNWGHEQVHMALLRGDGTYHSKLLSWGTQNPSINGRLWGWNPATSTTDNDCSSYPLSRFTQLTLDGGTPNLFCSGHSTLASGDLFIIGGQDGVLPVGLQESFVFRPNAPQGQQWAPKGLMQSGRWYPTSVTLPNGNALAFAGLRFQHAPVFGGTSAPQSPGGAATDDLNRLGLNIAGQSLTAITRPPGETNWPGPLRATARCGIRASSA